MANANLTAAKRAKNDEFYTQFADIQKEINAYLEYDPDTFRGKTVLLPCDDPDWSNFTKFFAQNFETLGLKKLISTSYAVDSKPVQLELFPSMVEEQSALYDASKTRKHGKLFILDHDTNQNGRIDIQDLELRQYLEGDGDFRSAEVKRLRDEADIIVTNPPFSLFREFMAWIMEANKKFLVIGNQNAITYKEIFPLIKNNKMWLGCSIHSGDREFQVPDAYPLHAAGCRIDDAGKKFIRVKGVRWFTNLDHGRRHQPLSLMTMADNIKHSPHKCIHGVGYAKYDNYNAIEVPFTDAIPSDYTGVMGVPISFLDKYCPEQFEIVKVRKGDDDRDLVYTRLTNSTAQHSTAQHSTAQHSTAQHSTAQHSNSSAVLQNPHQEESLRSILTTQYGYRNEELVWIPGVMGVPISFLDKYCPEQFEVLGITENNPVLASLWMPGQKKYDRPYLNGERMYSRILIQRRRN